MAVMQSMDVFEQVIRGRAENAGQKKAGQENDGQEYDGQEFGRQENDAQQHRTNAV